MGKGDQRTRRGKIHRGTHGNTRRKGGRKAQPPPAPAPRRPGAGSRPG